ncbi:MAG: hypothetical protein GY854_28255 [Deltaproteobacteria bacterium]|nr:hypothetical protein [Deltaproteobacteria bacterium]
MQRSTTFIVCIATFAFLICCAGAGPNSADEPTPEGSAASQLEDNSSGAESAGSIDESSMLTEPTGAEEKRGERKSVKALKVTEAVEVRSNTAINPKQSFRTGVRKIYASFQVNGVGPGGTIRVLWYQDDELFREDDIECEGEKRYAVPLERGKKLTNGDYAVEVEVDGEMFARRTFHVGGDNVSPVVEYAALGGTKGKNRIPKRAKTVFKSNVHAIRCGVRFLDLPDNAKIEVQWISFEDEGEKLLHTSNTEVPKGGTSNVTLDWKPEGDLTPGPHKAVVLLGGRKMRELAFTVE